MVAENLILGASPAQRPGLLKFCAPNAHSLENLRNRAIYCQHYAAFNDPFEFWARVYQGIPSLEKERARFIAAIREWGFEEDRLQDALEHSTEYFEGLVDAQPDFRAMYDGMRIACFGSDADNLLMWSHYADGLRGFCIVFDENEIEKAAPEGWIADVAYMDNPPIVDSFVYAIACDQEDFHVMALGEEARAKYLGKSILDGIASDYRAAIDVALTNMRRMWQHAFASKPLQWQYERERRLLIPSGRNDHQPLMLSYSNAAIKTIVVGERMSDTYLGQIREAADGIPIWRACRSADTYQLLIS